MLYNNQTRTLYNRLNPMLYNKSVVLRKEIKMLLGIAAVRLQETRTPKATAAAPVDHLKTIMP